MSQVVTVQDVGTVKGWKRYPAYKDSGVEWLGRIPAHWEVKRLKHLGKVNLSNVDKKSNENEAPVKLCNYVDVYYNDYITKEIDFLIATASHEQKQKFALKKGDVLLTKDSETWDDIAIPACVANDLDNVICGYHLAHIRPYQDRSIGEYIFRSISSTRLKEQFWVAANGVTRFGISKSSISDALLLEPPVSEQQQIAQFLDRETAKIDTLITKKERLIELLKEKRTALISHAVTKGLNPDAPMKDSGVEWLGRIPAHWEVKRLKHLGKVNLSNVDKKSNENEAPVKLCNYVDVYYNDYITKEIDFLIATASHEQKQKFALKKGDVLLTKDSETWDDIAIPACVANDLDNVICGYHLAHIRPYQDRSIGEYIFRSISSTRLKEQFWVAANGVTRFGISKSSISDALLLEPPVSEQQQIAQFLDRETAKIDTLITKTRTSIDLLKEHRTALISAAVTGKIDIREEVSPQ